MVKTKSQEVNNCKIYSIDYLMNEELTDVDISNILDTKSLLYSLVIGMFKEIGTKKRNSDIIKECRKDNKWITKYHWNKEQFDNYENKLMKIYKNIYSYSDEISKSKAEWFMTQYGFDVK